MNDWIIHSTEENTPKHSVFLINSQNKTTQLNKCLPKKEVAKHRPNKKLCYQAEGLCFCMLPRFNAMCGYCDYLHSLSFNQVSSHGQTSYHMMRECISQNRNKRWHFPRWIILDYVQMVFCDLKIVSYLKDYRRYGD